MANTDVTLFWSYVHKDDQAEGGRIRQLAQHVQREYQLRTGEELAVFFDKDSLKWGDDWQDSIEAALLETIFLVPVVTPSFLKSASCRTEVIKFDLAARTINKRNSILPILYVLPPSFANSQTTDEVEGILRNAQWIEWFDVRLKDHQSEAYRERLDQLVSQLILRIEQMEQSALVPVSLNPPENETTPTEPSNGAIEDVDFLERTMGGLTNRLNEFGPITNAVLEPISVMTTRLRTTSDRRLQIRLFEDAARDLNKPIADLESFVTDFHTTLDEISPPIIRLIEFSRSFPEAQDFRSNLASLEELYPTAAEAFGPLTQVADQIDAMGGISSSLRRPFRRISDALRRMTDTVTIFKYWHEELISSDRLDHPPSAFGIWRGTSDELSGIAPGQAS